MNEYIFEIKEALYNKETGEAVMKPKCIGELIRCKDCELHCPDDDYYAYVKRADDFCSWAKRREE